MSESSAAQYAVSICVFRSEPVDFQKWRHTLLCFRSDDQKAVMVAHAVGLAGDFSLQARQNFDPTSSATFAKEVFVGSLLSQYPN